MNWFKNLLAPKNNKPLIGKLAIVVGHEKKAQGAWAAPPMKMSEYDFNKNHIAPLMTKFAQNMGLETKIFLRDGLGISGVGREVSKWADDKTVSIELHFNSSSGMPIGTLTLYDSNPTKNKILAENIQGAMCNVFSRSGHEDRGIELTNTGRGAGNLVSVQCHGVLVEPVFANVPSEARLLWERKEDYAYALVQTAKDFILSHL